MTSSVISFAYLNKKFNIWELMQIFANGKRGLDFSNLSLPTQFPGSTILPLPGASEERRSRGRKDETLGTRSHHFSPECIAFNQSAMRHFLPDFFAALTSQPPTQTFFGLVTHVFMTHQNLRRRLGKNWKLFSATLKGKIVLEYHQTVKRPPKPKGHPRLADNCLVYVYQFLTSNSNINF